MEPKWLDWAKQLQSIAQAGIAYSKDKYDLERFEMLRELSVEMLAEHTEIDQTVIKDLFANDPGYPTPKIDVRAVIFENEKILMVKEETDQLWALPGGWGDIGMSPSEVAVTEVEEEAGLIVRPMKLIGIADKLKHPHPPAAYHSYKIFIQCEIVGGIAKPGMETTDVGFFAENNLPDLSTNRNTASQIKLAFKHMRNPNLPAFFD